MSDPRVEDPPPDGLVLLDPLVMRSRVTAAHYRARAKVATPRDSFLVYPDEEATLDSHTNGVREFSRRESEEIQDFLRAQAASERLQGEGSDVATIRKVMGVQRPDHVTEFTIGGKNSSNYLPGGAPLVDHLMGRLLFMSDWQVILPAVRSLRDHRLPNPDKPASQREIVLGETSERHIQVALEWVRNRIKLTKKTFLTCTLAADTESIAVEYQDYLDLMDGPCGANHTVRLARTGRPAESLPVVLSVGHVGWHVGIRIPTIPTVGAGGRPCLRIVPGTLQKGVPAFLKELGIMTGVRLVEDLKEFFGLVSHLYGTDLLQHITVPLELDRLARLAGFNLARSGVETLNWICFGTILPKGRCSRGDGKWHLPWDALSTPLRAYMAADISQCAGAAELFKYLWAMRMFPDLHAVSQVSVLSPAQLLPWWEKHVIYRIDSYAPILNWRVASTMEEVWTLLLGASKDGLVVAGLQPGWSSMVAGGPRFTHSTRAFLLDKLETLREMSPSTWPVLPATVLNLVLFNRHGIKSHPAPPDPVKSLQWHPDPCVRGELPCYERVNWAAIRRLSGDGVGTKALILEFTRISQLNARDLLVRVEAHRRTGSTVFGCMERAARLVPSMRGMLATLNDLPPRPDGWVDLYKEEQAKEERLARLTARAAELAARAKQEAQAKLRLCSQLKEAVRTAQKRPLGSIGMTHPLLQLIAPVGPGAAAPLTEEQRAAIGGPPPPKRRRRGPRRSRPEARARACQPMAMLRESLQRSRQQEVQANAGQNDDEVVITRVVVNNLCGPPSAAPASEGVTAGGEVADDHQVGPLRPPRQDAHQGLSPLRPSIAAVLSSGGYGRPSGTSRGSRGTRSRRHHDLPAGVRVLADTLEDSGAAAFSAEDARAATRGPWSDERHRREPQSPPLSPSVWAMMRANALPLMESRPPGGRPG